MGGATLSLFNYRLPLLLMHTFPQYQWTQEERCIQDCHATVQNSQPQSHSLNDFLLLKWETWSESRIKKRELTACFLESLAQAIGLPNDKYTFASNLYTPLLCGWRHSDPKPELVEPRSRVPDGEGDEGEATWCNNMLVWHQKKQQIRLKMTLI